MDEPQEKQDPLLAWIETHREVIATTSVVAGVIGFVVGGMVKTRKFDRQMLAFADGVQATINEREWTRIRVKGRGYDWKITRYLE